jgi:hypothetical protein
VSRCPEHRASAGFRSHAARLISGPNREEVLGDWRGLHNEELHSFYVSLGIINVSRRESFTSYNIKVKVKLSLCHAMKAYWGVKV